MEEKDRKAIQNNFSSLVEQTDLDSVVTLLYEKGVFSEAMIEPYRDTNRDLRTRKRQLYRDIERRGPTAFENLIDVLTETGHWNLVRALSPKSMLQPHVPTPTISIKNNRRPTPGANSQTTAPDPTQTAPPPPEPASQEPSSLPPFSVIQSSKFHDGPDCYVTRTKMRGIALILTNITFDNNIETDRRGAEVDERNLKQLFDQIGFHQTLSYKDLTRQEMKSTIETFIHLRDLGSTECVFVVIASHGHARAHTNDVDIRCKDGLLLSAFYVIEQFNNHNCPNLKDVPKVFIFQTCRGGNEDSRAMPSSVMRRPSAECDGFAIQPERLYSDILIANATIPGYVSYRDPDKGSWYIQTLCKVFAEHAHDTHVDELFKKVDLRLAEDFAKQTSSIDRWGFNKKLYLHPGLVDHKQV